MDKTAPDSASGDRSTGKQTTWQQARRASDVPGRRVTIYLPKPLAARLEAVKERVNVSKVCQDAIEIAVAAEEMVGTDDRKARIVRRLLEAEEALDRLYRQGFADGQGWAESAANWDQLKTVATWSRLVADSQITTKRPGPGTAFTNLPSLAALGLAPATLFLPPGAPSPPADAEDADSRLLYFTGMRDGVRSVYELVKDLMEPPKAAAPTPEAEGDAVNG